MLKQSIAELTNAINNGKKNNDPKDNLKVKLSEKSGKDILEYLKNLEDIIKTTSRIK